jgi:cyclase
MERLFECGVEKVLIGNRTIDHLDFVRKASDRFGSQSIVVTMDVKKNWLGQYEVYSDNGRRSTGFHPVQQAVNIEKAGAGEILINAISRDGTMSGYDVELIKQVSGAVNIPVIACGGCGSLNDISEVIFSGGASAAAAGSFFVFHGPRKAVLINFPDKKELEAAFSQYADGSPA